MIIIISTDHNSMISFREIFKKKAIQKSDSEVLTKFGVFYDKKMAFSSNNAS